MRLRFLNPKRSLAGRLALIVVGAVTLALALGSCLLAWCELDRYVDDKRAALRTSAQIIASSGARATAAGDAVAAEATLRAIAHDPSFLYAALARADGTILAEHGLGLRLDDDIDLDREGQIPFWRLASTRTLKITVPVIDNAQPIGQVVLVADASELGSRMAQVGLSAGLAGLLAIVAGLAVSLRLQRSVTRPLAALARTMEVVGHRHDYTQRAPVTTNDEVGALASTFNALLSTINERDRRIAQHGARLEDEVRDRTLDLDDARQAAEAANAAKSTFLATMSHEIRTPLNGMLVMAEMLACADLPPRQARYADVIARSGQSLLGIINDVLDFAKIEAGRIEVERIPTDPRDLADTVLTLFGERARLAGLDLAARIAPDVPRTLAGDPTRLGQVLGNFVSNAIKFTPEGHVLIRMEVVAEPGETRTFLRIGVEDTGIGIPDDRLSQVFAAFTQADASTTRRFGGTGLGLSIAERLIGAMGGRVGVESRVGAGSTFWARIPIEDAEAMEPAPTRDASVDPSVHLNGLGPATRRLLATELDRAGFRLGDAASATWIVEASALVARGERPAAARRVIALAPIGDPGAGRAIEEGLADEVLRWPIVQSEWRSLLAALAQGTPVATPTRPNAKASGSPTYPGARVLVADDSAVNREVATEALARFGIAQIVCVEDGAAAVEAVAHQPFDIVLMDGSMPVLDGFAAARRIRANEARTGSAPVPIIAVTAHVVGQEATMWRDAGMDGVLAKPFSLSQLGALLATHLDSSVRPSQEDMARDGLAGTGSQPRAETSQHLLSAQVVENLRELGSADFLERVLRLYTQQAPAAFAAMEDAVAAQDGPAIAKAAHSLKSMSSNIGAVELASMAGVVERAARDGTPSPSGIDTTTLRAVLDQTLDALQLEFGSKVAA